MFRNDIINYFIKKYDFKRYLEIGVFDGGNIRQIKCEHIDGVDPGAEDIVADEVNYKMTSNEFFNDIAPNVDKYDIVFIDGLHHSEQVSIDIVNALKFTNDNGIIILHDCNPPTLGHSLIPRTQLAWNGDVYKAVLKFQKENIVHKYYTIDTDWGVGVIHKNIPTEFKLNFEEYENGINNWNYFDSNRKILLNLKTVNEFENGKQ